MLKRIAIIGGGMAGLTAAYLLRNHYEITLFERTDRLGGNAFTLDTQDGQEADIAAAVFGRSSYQNLFRLFNKLQIETVGPSGMPPFGLSGLGVSFLDLDRKNGLYLTPSLRALIPSRFRTFSPRTITTMMQFRAGLDRAISMLASGELEGSSLEHALDRMPEWTGDARLILMCCLCLITSMHCDDVLDGPASFFVQKMLKHRDLLPPQAFRSVRFTKHRTRSYVEALSRHIAGRIVLNAEIAKVRRSADGAAVGLANGREEAFDLIVFACNADQALRLLAQPTQDEQRLLGAWRYTEGSVVVHRDHARFPVRELMEGYTFLYRKQGRYIGTSVSGSLWVLPGVPRTSDLISTQHPNFPIRPDLVVFEKVFRTPIFDDRAWSTIKELPRLNGVLNTYYCGSHFGFGLHEDAVTSAMEVARLLGGESV